MSCEKYEQLKDRSVIELRGPDMRSFLQGLISNDIDALGPAKAIYTALLTPQGKFLFDFFLIEVEDAIWLECLERDTDALLRKLTLYRMRSKVELTKRDDLAVMAVWGDDAPNGNWKTYQDPRLPQLGWRLIGEPKELTAAAGTLGEAGDYVAHRLALGVPVADLDIVREKSILLECNFEELHGVSFTKGCFVGQELTARTKHRGLVKRRLLPVEVDGGMPENGTSILSNDKPAGEIRSGFGNFGIAQLRLEHIGGDLSADGKPVRVRQVDWLPRLG